MLVNAGCGVGHSRLRQEAVSHCRLARVSAAARANDAHATRYGIAHVQTGMTDCGGCLCLPFPVGVCGICTLFAAHPKWHESSAGVSRGRLMWLSVTSWWRQCHCRCRCRRAEPDSELQTLQPGFGADEPIWADASPDAGRAAAGKKHHHARGSKVGVSEDASPAVHSDHRGDNGGAVTAGDTAEAAAPANSDAVTAAAEVGDDVDDLAGRDHGRATGHHAKVSPTATMHSGSGHGGGAPQGDVV